MIVVILVNHTLSFLIEGCDGRVGPPLVQVSIFVIFTTWSHTHKHTQVRSTAVQHVDAHTHRHTHRCCQSRALTHVQRWHRWLRNSVTCRQRELQFWRFRVILSDPGGLTWDYMYYLRLKSFSQINICHKFILKPGIISSPEERLLKFSSRKPFRTEDKFFFFKQTQKIK